MRTIHPISAAPENGFIGMKKRKRMVNGPLKEEIGGSMHQLGSFAEVIHFKIVSMIMRFTIVFL